MHLTRKHHRNRLARFEDIRPARKKGGRCGAPEPESARTCTRAREHRGPHAAHGAFGRLLSVWDPVSTEIQPSSESRATRAAARRGRSARGEDDPGPVERFAARVVRTLSSPDQLAMVMLFIGLVVWGLSVAFRIVSGW